MTGRETVKAKEESKLKKIYRKDDQLPNNFNTHQPVSLEVFKEFGIISNGHFGRISLSKHHIHLLIEGVRPIKSAFVPFRARSNADFCGGDKMNAR